MQKTRQAVLGAIALLMAAGQAPGQEPGGAFRGELNAICALGQQRTQGCDAIRDRDVLDAASPPWSAIGRINFASTDTGHHCTGTLVSERMVLTAAHCLYNLPRKRWLPPESVRFAAGYQRGASVALARGVRFVLPDGQDTGTPVFRTGKGLDWALVELDQPLGAGRDLFAVARDSLSGRWAELPGYAGLRPHVLTLATQCGRSRAAPNGMLYAKCPAMQGDSGAPVLDRETREIIGILSRLVVTSGGDALNEIVPASRFVAEIE